MRKHWHVLIRKSWISSDKNVTCKTKREAETVALAYAEMYRDDPDWIVFGNKKRGYLIQPRRQSFPPLYEASIWVTLERCEKSECVTH